MGRATPLIGDLPGRAVAKRAAQVAAVAGIGVLGLAGLAASSPTVRAEAHRLRQYGRPLVAHGKPPVPPPLPPGRVIEVARRGELFVRDTGGAGPVVLLLHGWAATADVNFFTAYPALSGYRAIALDHRSHGRGLRTEPPFRLEDCADDAAALLRTLGIGQALVVGYSMGGTAALLLARRHPEQVAGLVLAATALDFCSEPRDRALWRALSLVEGIFRHGRGDGVVQRLLREAVQKDPALDAYEGWLGGELRRGYVPGLIEAGRALEEFDARAYAAEIGKPSAVIVTTDDRLVPPRKQRALARAMGARVFELAGDHDAAITMGGIFGGALRAAIDHVAELAGSGAPGAPGVPRSSGVPGAGAPGVPAAGSAFDVGQGDAPVDRRPL